MKHPRTYLTERVTLEEILAEHDNFQTCTQHFGEDWERLLKKKRDGDELWCFAPPPRAMELWGIALVRNGEIIATLLEAVG